jgi:hypothetical protein
MVRMLDRLNARAEWKFVGVLLHADRSLAIAWWAALALRVLAALFAIAMGALVGAVQRGDSVATPRIYVGAIRAASNIATVPPCNRREPWQPDCGLDLRSPDEHNDVLHRVRVGRDDWRTAIGGGARGVRVVGAAAASQGLARDALATTRKRRVARSQYGRGSRGVAPADYAGRLTVDPPAAKELRLFGQAGSTIDRFYLAKTTSI